MRTIDMHAHLLPRSWWKAVEANTPWYGFHHEPGPGAGVIIGGGKRAELITAKVRYAPEQRLEDMDAQGVDVQVLSVHMPLVGYHLDAAVGQALARDVNQEIADTTRQWPTRFAGLATLPMQDVKTAIRELEFAVNKLGLKGAELDTQVNGEQWDDPKFLPFFKAAEAMGAVLFFHPQPQNNFLRERNPRHRLYNSLGVVLDDAIVAATLICGGVLEACPEIRICIAHGGGPACYVMGRLDHAWEAQPKDQRTPLPPSEYQKRMYYDTVTSSEEALRFLLDRVGAERVVIGSDWPFVPWNPGPGGWVQSLRSLTQDEKDKILWKNLEALLKI